VETGLFGLGSFIVLLWVILRRTLRIYKTTADDFYEGLSIGFLAATVGMITHALTANTFIIIRIMEPYWFFAAMVLMVPQLEKSMAKAPSSPVQEPGQGGDNIRNIKFLVNSGWKA
jgi:O-antigen ligase